MNEKTFEQAWAQKEAEGYQYGADALEQVRFGWELAMAESVATRKGSGPPEAKPQTIPCPCSFGVVFQDARGGYECTACDTRFHIYRDPPQAYGGPSGPLTLFEQLRAWVGLWLLPKEKKSP